MLDLEKRIQKWYDLFWYRIILGSQTEELQKALTIDGDEIKYQ